MAEAVHSYFNSTEPVSVVEELISAFVALVARGLCRGLTGFFLSFIPEINQIPGKSPLHGTLYFYVSPQDALRWSPKDW